ncbi:dephospho-CoA kinase [Rhodococcus sp. WB9]|uniref:dephospho-CoA kinase n=1 Tax=Rhodococcus sp. WB9 TaxID=2594007 RepID=UPI0011860AA9|nr:dephospho-CoA kinase [Rhodococcus sp. WB9]QDQ93298.1 dephospho-CoA kinase [Rhodococcus sp. WB9]
MLRIGLTGGIGAGKSTVSKVLAELGAVIIDADLIAREVVEPGTPGLAALVDRFGEEILTEDGALDRPALAARAFADDESRLALNAIVHPLVGARTTETIEAAPKDAILVQDIPLLVEGGMGAAFHLVVVVFVDAEERVRRLVGSRGMPENDARARIAAQADDDQRRAAADVWLDNSGAPGALEPEIRALWSERLVPFESNIRTRSVVRVLPELAPPNPQWPAQADRLIARLTLVCGDRAVRIDHIGSTAVEGLPAKDVIDVQVTVANLETADDLAESLADAGFPRIEHITADDPKPSYQGGETDPALWGKRIHGGADPGRPVNIHIRVDGWPGQQFALVFRDWLRADTDARTEYLAVKEGAAEKAAGHTDYRDAITAYVDAKSPWFDRAYHRAWEWAERTGWSA